MEGDWHHALGIGILDTIYIRLDGTSVTTAVIPFAKGLTSGADTDGYDVKFYGSLSNSYFLWDESNGHTYSRAPVATLFLQSEEAGGSGMAGLRLDTPTQQWIISNENAYDNALLFRDGTNNRDNMQIDTSGNFLLGDGDGNPWFRMYGNIDTSSLYVQWQLDDVDDYFHLTKAPAANGSINGFKIEMPVDLVANSFITTSTVTAANFISTVAIGTSPYACTSTTLNTNLNADMLDGKHVGTSGNTVPVLDVVNTWSADQIFSTKIAVGWSADPPSAHSLDVHTSVYVGSHGMGAAGIIVDGLNKHIYVESGILGDALALSGLIGGVRLQKDALGDVTSFEEATEGHAPGFYIYGYNTGFTLKYGKHQIVSIDGFQVYQITSDTGIIDFHNDNVTTAGIVTGLNFISAVAIGTSPYACTSTTLNTNLNADMLDGKHVGTSGNTIPLLDGTNTWSGTQTLDDIDFTDGKDAYLESYKSGFPNARAGNYVYFQRLGATVAEIYHHTSGVAGQGGLNIKSTTDINLSANAGAGRIKLLGEVIFTEPLGIGKDLNTGEARTDFYFTGNDLLLRYYSHGFPVSVPPDVFNINPTNMNTDFQINGDTGMVFLLDAGDENITINDAKVSANYDLMLAGDGILGLKETATPTADVNYGKVYCKNDNKLYFQDGAGAEHEIAFV